VQPTPFRAKLQEPAVPGDPRPNQTSEPLPTYSAYSIDGDVTAPMVYVNPGSRDDYEQVDRLGISMKGANRHCPLRRSRARRQAQGCGSPKVAAERCWSVQESRSITWSLQLSEKRSLLPTTARPPAANSTAAQIGVSQVIGK
jgi:hypothetical protein